MAFQSDSLRGNMFYRRKDGVMAMGCLTERNKTRKYRVYNFNPADAKADQVHRKLKANMLPLEPPQQTEPPKCEVNEPTRTPESTNLTCDFHPAAPWNEYVKELPEWEISLLVETMGNITGHGN
jgi:hypothetical protein